MVNLVDFDSDEVVIGRPGEASATLGRPKAASDGALTRVPLGLSADGLSVQTAVELAEWNGGTARLTSFFDDLASGWRGWAGEKHLEDDGPTVSLRATHDGLGLVTLLISAKPFAGWKGPGAWELSVFVPVEAGSLESLAHSIRSLLAAAE